MLHSINIIKLQILFSDECSNVGITMDGGYARVYSSPSLGCTNRCSLHTTQVYVLVQMGTSSPDKKVCRFVCTQMVGLRIVVGCPFYKTTLSSAGWG